MAYKLVFLLQIPLHGAAAARYFTYACSFFAYLLFFIVDLQQSKAYIHMYCSLERHLP